MSRTAIILKYKDCLLLDEASYWAEKLLTDINLLPLMPDADNNFGGSLGLDSKKWWRHVRPKNFGKKKQSLFFKYKKLESNSIYQTAEETLDSYIS